ncbi:hypothetical protein TWF281_006601 [Arthrobotrys megalospora]
MLFSKILVLLGVAATATAAVIPTEVLRARVPTKTEPEKRTITGHFLLQVQGGTLDGKYLAGHYDTTGGWVSDVGEALEFFLGTGGLLDSVEATPSVLGWDDHSWVFFDNGSDTITGCSIDGSDNLVGCTATSSVYTYTKFGTAANNAVLAMGNSLDLTNFAAYDGEEITLKAIAV